MVQNEVRWILATIVGNWPEVSFPDDVARIDKRTPEVLETGQRTNSVDLMRWNVIECDFGSRVREPLGTEWDYRVETVLDLRIEGLHEDEHGHIEDDDDFERLVKRTQAALNAAREYPDVDPDDDSVGRVQYHSLFIEDESDVSGEHGDHFGRSFSVRMTGRKSNP